MSTLGELFTAAYQQLFGRVAYTAGVDWADRIPSEKSLWGLMSLACTENGAVHRLLSDRQTPNVDEGIKLLVKYASDPSFEAKLAQTQSDDRKRIFRAIQKLYLIVCEAEKGPAVSNESVYDHH